MAKLKDTIIKNTGSSKILDIQNTSGGTICAITPEGYIKFSSSSANIGIGNLSNPFASTQANSGSDTVELYPSIPAGENQTTKIQLPTIVDGATYTVYCPMATSTHVSTFEFYLGTSTALNNSLLVSERIQIYSAGRSIQFSFVMNGTTNNYLWCKTFSPNEASPTLDPLTISYVKDTSSITNSISIGNGAKSQHEKTVSIGYNAGISATGNFASTNINCTGASAYRIALGIGAAPLIYYSSSSAAGSAITSDRRDKCDFKDIENATSFLSKLKPVTYCSNNRYDYCENDDINKFDEEAYMLQKNKGDRRHAGLVAQDTLAALKDTYNDDNYADIVDYNNYNGDKADSEFDKYYMRYSAIIPFLIKGFQEQQEYISKLENEIEKLKNK